MTISNITQVLAEEDYLNVELIESKPIENVQSNESNNLFDIHALRGNYVTGTQVGQLNNGYTSMSNNDIAFVDKKIRHL